MTNRWIVLSEGNIDIVDGMWRVCSTGQQELNHIVHVKYLIHHEYIFTKMNCLINIL